MNTLKRLSTKRLEEIKAEYNPNLNYQGPVKTVIAELLNYIATLEHDFNMLNMGCNAVIREGEQLSAQLAAYKGCEEALEYYGFKIVPDSLNKGKTEITTQMGETAREALEVLRKARG